MDPTLAAGFLDAFSGRWGTPERLGLTGGEPLLYPGLTEKLIRLCAGRGILVRLLTNASWAQERGATLRRVERLRRAGLSGFWISAGSFHQEWIPFSSVLCLVQVSSNLGIPCYVNFAYLHPRADGVRGRGIPGISQDLSADRETRSIHERFADLNPTGTHGWARVWDIGRGKALLDGLGEPEAGLARADLARAVEKGKGDLVDLVGLGLDSSVFFRETVIGRSPTGRFDRLLSKIYPRSCHAAPAL